MVILETKRSVQQEEKGDSSTKVVHGTTAFSDKSFDPLLLRAVHEANVNQ